MRRTKRITINERPTGTGRIVFFSVGIFLLLASGCGSGPSVATQIEELEADLAQRTARNATVESAIAEALEDLEPGALEGTHMSDDQYNAALETLDLLQSLAETCGDNPVACGVLADLPIDRVDTALPPDQQVEAKIEFAEAVLQASENLLYQCGRLVACTVVTTTTSPPPTTTRPRVTSPPRTSPPRNDSPASYSYPASPILFLTCNSSIQDCYVERQNGRQQYSSPYRVDGTKSSPSATTRFFDPFGNCYNVVVYEAPIPYAPWVKASSC